MKVDEHIKLGNNLCKQRCAKLGSLVARFPPRKRPDVTQKGKQVLVAEFLDPMKYFKKKKKTHASTG